MTLLALGNGAADIITAMTSVEASLSGGNLAISGLIGNPVVVVVVVVVVVFAEVSLPDAVMVQEDLWSPQRLTPLCCRATRGPHSV